jgi:hypothetical protein
MGGKFSAGVLLVFIVAARPALADPSAADRATARALAQEGQQAFEARRYDVAADKFSRADALVHAPTLLLGLAHAQVGLGQFVEAQESYNRIIREGVTPGSPRPWFKALEDAAKEIESITPRVAWVTISVRGSSNPEVVVDGAAVPVASLGVKRPVNPGNHNVKASAEGFTHADKAFSLGEGQSTSVTLEIAAIPGAAPLASVADAPEPETVNAPARGRRVPAYVAFGVGGAGLILGAVTGAIAWSKHQKLADECPGGSCDLAHDGEVRSYHTVGVISAVGFATAGVGAGVGLALLLTEPKSARLEERRAGYVSPYVGLGAVGLRGAF